MPEGKTYQWNPEKNIQLQQERGISFEIVSQIILQGRALDTIDHPNQEKYPFQKMFVLEIDNYIYLVPFVESSNIIFLKTIIPSRKMKKKYLGD